MTEGAEEGSYWQLDSFIGWDDLLISPTNSDEQGEKRAGAREKTGTVAIIKPFKKLLNRVRLKPAHLHQGSSSIQQVIHL